MKAYRGSTITAPLILNLDTRWRWVISFMPRPLYHCDKIPAPNEQETDWAPEPIWTFWREKKIVLTGNQTRTVQPVWQSLHQLPTCDWWSVVNCFFDVMLIIQTLPFAMQMKSTVIMDIWHQFIPDFRSYRVPLLSRIESASPYFFTYL